MPVGVLIAAAIALAALGLSLGSGGTSSTPSNKKSRLKTGPISSNLLTFNLLSGNVLETPNQIAQMIENKTGKSLTTQTVVLASMIASETGSGPRIAKEGVAWAAKNAAKSKGMSVLKLLAPNDQLGAQGIRGRSYAATARPPNAIDLDVAAKVLDGRTPDPTMGSRYFDSPSAFRALAATEGYGENREQERIDKMHASGYTEFYLPGVNRDYLRLWRKGSSQQAVA